ncbi:MAG: hypothetical protein KC656_34540, partial [Myxococcales bacterium]|nr:hypothetical protein [Myxococcales bacterium]
LDGSLALPDLPVEGTPTHAVRVMMGLLIVVQGFETSRFLGAEHPPEERVATMRIAQLASAAIYVLFVTLMLPLLHGGLSADVTAIVGLVGPVATVLPTLIVVAAIGSQLNAAVADDAGCVGLMETIVGDRLSPRWVYLVVGGLAIGVTWLTDVLSVISVASRAFALFYALQCLVTVATALEREDAEHRRVFMVAGGVLALIAASVTVLGIPASA